MKILYIIPRFYPFRGGAEQNIEAMATRMANEGHEVTLYTSNVAFRNEKLPWIENYKGIQIYRHWALNESLYAGFYPGILPRLLKNEFDIVHVSGFGFIWIEFCLIIKKIFDSKVKIINTPHGPFMAFTKTKPRAVIKKIYTQILKIIIPFIYSKIIAVVPTQNKWMTEEYNISNKNIELIPNGIDSSFIEKNIPVFKKDEKVIITYLNRMEWYKGIQDVLYALDTLDIKTKNKIEFWIMGREGSYTSKLKQIVHDKKLQQNVKFIYTPTDEQRNEAFIKSQINILPSKWEATGIVLIEAMAKGNVIITTFQNEASSLLINSNSGYVYNFSDIAKLSEILNEVVNDYKKRQQMIKYNHSFVNNFTWDSSFPKYIKLVNTLISENKKS